MTPEDLLYVLNDCEPVDLTGFEYAVATKPAPPGVAWNPFANAFSDTSSWWPFAPAEVTVVDESGREPFKDGRHSRKWGVTFEYFDTLGEALACRQRVLAGLPEEGRTE